MQEPVASIGILCDKVKSFSSKWKMVEKISFRDHNY